AGALPLSSTSSRKAALAAYPGSPNTPESRTDSGSPPCGLRPGSQSVRAPPPPHPAPGAADPHTERSAPPVRLFPFAASLTPSAPARAQGREFDAVSKSKDRRVAGDHRRRGPRGHRRLRTVAAPAADPGG